ncbi:ABC transporter ATP-binding protein [Methanoplanus sp. FWC-SCC4]|uniref:ABC transporter ATP-binding protein n=1 Tax=Methanochimaera problematica TaxID=2609417 RepID=A0AA97FB46_9EURY|nr:ABC transporter ATP-binding protein [Methanoplanus sp. FWC-SCC4]WOF15317.1 ABC transporter ATP-binding protein [Methanoplanus sp. FWC-SCC4]
MKQGDPLIRVCSLDYSYTSSIFPGKKALQGISLEIYPGETVLIAGPSGSGKSTLIKCLNGLIPNSGKGKMTGKVFINGMDTSVHSVPEISRVSGYVFQNPDYQIITNEVDSEIAFGPEQAGIPPEDIEKRISRVTNLLGITHLRGRETTALSWGEMQKVAIASVLVMEPKILLMDEPFSGLDSESASYLLGIIRDISKSGRIATVIIEHRADMALSSVNRLVALNSGQIIYDGPACACPDDIIEKMDGGYDLPSTQSGKNYGVSSPGFAGVSFGKQDNKPSVVLRDVSYHYPGSSSDALCCVNVSFYPYEIVAVCGANGSGKSTLAKHINGLLKPDSGEVYIFDENIGGKTVAEVARYVSLVSQHADSQLFEETIERELSFGPKNLGFDERETGMSVDEVMELVGISHLGKGARPLKLSVGEKQRVAIASHLTMKAPVVIMDEPTLGLDLPLKKRLAETLISMKKEGKCIIIITHDMRFADFCADRKYFCENGRISCINN